VIITSHILHQFSEERCVHLLSRIADAAKPGGRLVVHDFMPAGDQPAAEPLHALFSVLMLTWSGAGEAHSLETYQRLVANAGFGAMETHPGIGVPSTFLIAERCRP
jgi:ubiquinone/menaquinone biosynthesis C-methylase UbiE